MIRKIVLFAFMVSIVQYGDSFDGISLVDIKDVLRFGKETMIDILESWEMIKPKTPEEEDSFPFVYRMERELRNRILAVSKKIDVYQQKTDMHIDEIVARLSVDLPLQEDLNQKLSMLDAYVARISELFRNFQKYSSSDKYERYTLEDFARTCVSSRADAVPDTLKNIHRLLVPSNNHTFSKSILVLVAKQMNESGSQLCMDNVSLHQLLYNLYATVTLTEIKGYSMIKFSYILLRLYNPGSNFAEEMNMVEEQYYDRTSETVRAVKVAMAFAPRELWKCDAFQPKLDETYTKLTDLFQGYIVNEVDLNPQGTCKENCAYYSYAKVHGCFKDLYCSQQRKCNGNVIHCEYVDSDMWICPADKNSNRRYDYITYENGKRFGKQKNYCDRGLTKVDSWWRWLFWHCSYCFCYCDDQTPKSDRYFSLRNVTSDIRNNKVITGVALKKVKQIIHIQIQEGELLPRGNINMSTLSWKPIEEFSVLDKHVKDGVDYHTISWEKRGVDLDDLITDQDHLVTGLKFRQIGPRINLEIMVTPFNYTTGKLINPFVNSFWMSNDITERKQLKFSYPDVPTRVKLPSLPDSKKQQYLNFEPSDRLADAAQNTIPFIDTQRVESNTPVPLSGIGIYHKGASGSGGYLAMKLITYDFAPHLMVDLPSSPPILKYHDKVLPP